MDNVIPVVRGFGEGSGGKGGGTNAGGGARAKQQCKAPGWDWHGFVRWVQDADGNAWHKVSRWEAAAISSAGWSCLGLRVPQRGCGRGSQCWCARLTACQGVCCPWIERAAPDLADWDSLPEPSPRPPSIAHCPPTRDHTLRARVRKEVRPPSSVCSTETDGKGHGGGRWGWYIGRKGGSGGRGSRKLVGTIHASILPAAGP